MLIGLPWMQDGFCHNGYALLDGGRIAAVRLKVDLPNYGVFDEKRVFRPGPAPGPVAFRGVRLGLPICEDIWGPDVVEVLHETGAEILLSPNGSPYWRGKDDERLSVATARVVESRLPLVYLNQVGGQDELVFDGGSFILNPDCSLGGRLPSFAETVAKVVFARETGGWRCVEAPDAPVLDDDKADYAACVLGLRDYVQKNNFPGVVLGMSGGVDSGSVRRAGGGRAGAFERPRDHAALSLHVGGIAPGRRRMRQGFSVCAMTSCRSPPPSRASRRRWRRCSPGRRAA